MGRWLPIALMVLAILSPGCQMRGPRPPLLERDEYLEVVARDVQFPDLAPSPLDDSPYAGWDVAPPNTLANGGPKDYWDMTLDEAIQIAFHNSQVLRDFGGTILTRPLSVATVYDPAIVEADPRFGVEAALSAFDAQVSLSKNFFNNDRALNNEIVGVGTRLLKQDLNAYRAQISKQTAGGTRFSLRNNTDYDANNSPRNLFPSAWAVNFEGEFRHPLAQGAGTMFNRVAGPNGAPGQLNGVVIARINADISQADFETSLRDFISDVENAYWELYFTYRELDVKIEARDRALKSWRAISAKEAALPGGDADKERKRESNTIASRKTSRTPSAVASCRGAHRGWASLRTCSPRPAACSWRSGICACCSDCRPATGG